jgi:LCP family protein required for cell wall assembly
MAFHDSPAGMKKSRATKKRPLVGWLWRIVRVCCWLCLCVLLAIGAFLLSFVFFPPFGDAATARVLLIGLDDKTPNDTTQRSDSLILYAAKMPGGGATLLSVPRDARVRLAGDAHFNKINAAYSKGGESLLERTLADPTLLHDHFSSYIIYDTSCVTAVIDALGGLYVDVPRDMNYDDSWSGLHIHLNKGKHQLLMGKDIAGYLRWRKNNDGRGSSSDFERTERQRQVLVAIKEKMVSWSGLMKLPMIYLAFKQTANTNLSFTQLVALAGASRQIQTESIPGVPRTIDGVSYVICDWNQARQLWALATH